MRQFHWLTAAATIVVASMLIGCKSKPRCGTCTAPAPLSAPSQAFIPDPMPPAMPPSAPSTAQVELEAAQSQLESEQSRRMEMEARAREAEDRLAQAQARIDRLKGESMAALPPAAPDPIPPAPVAPSPEPIASATSATRLANDLRAGAGLEVVETTRTVTVRVSDAFRSGSDRLKPDGALQSALSAAARAIAQHPDAAIAVVGHSDMTPISRSGWPSNTALSLARARTVAEFLADQGIQPSRIAVDGRGEREPLVQPERTSADRSRNRRVEILVRF